MARVRVLQPGMLTTVQDLGRPALSAMGIARGGAADTLSLRVANMLVGNPQGAAALEMTLTGGTFEFESEAYIAVTGATASASIEHGSMSREIPLWSRQRIEAGQRLRIGPVTAGARVYLATSGGIDVPQVLGSASTHLGASFGGMQGRALRTGDTLALGTVASASSTSIAPSAHTISCVREWLASRVLHATHTEGASPISAEHAQTLWDSSFVVSPQSNRVGIRLEGPPIAVSTRGTMTSEGMMHGAVQVPENGQPIMLGVDHPTTGGYPVIASVVAADLSILGQLRPGEQVRFARISHDAARTRYLQLESLLAPSGTNP